MCVLGPLTAVSVTQIDRRFSLSATAPKSALPMRASTRLRLLQRQRSLLCATNNAQPLWATRLQSMILVRISKINSTRKFSLFR